MECRLTVGVAIKLKERGLLDVFALPGSAEEFAKIISDADLFPRVLWEMTDQTCDLATFRLLVAATDQESLWTAFRDEVLDFFQDPIREKLAALAVVLSETPSVNRTSPLSNETPSDWSPSPSPGIHSGSWPVSLDSTLVASPTVNWSEWPGAENVPIGLAQAG